MTKYLAWKNLVLIVALMMSQLGNTFAFSSQMSDCGMDMSSSAAHRSATIMTDTAHNMVNEHVSAPETMLSIMDCCDMTATMSCCDGDCQCSSFIATSVFVSTSEFNKVDNSTSKPSIARMTNPLAPFLHQPKRPPIKNIS